LFVDIIVVHVAFPAEGLKDEVRQTLGERRKRGVTNSLITGVFAVSECSFWSYQEYDLHY